MKSTKVHLYMTGFGPFLTVTINPSAAIAEEVAKQITKNNMEIKVQYEELEVNLEATSSYFNQLEETIKNHMKENNKDEEEVYFLLIHIGVHSSEEEGKIRLEVCGYNEIEGKVIDETLPINATLESVFTGNENNNNNNYNTLLSSATTSLIDKLNKIIKQKTENNDDDDDEGRQKPYWIISHDAGRYYCNYALYRALQIQNKWKGKVFSVFIHVSNPLIFNNPSLKEQTLQVYSLVSGLVNIVKGAI